MFISKPFQSPLVDSLSTFPALEISCFFPFSELFRVYHSIPSIGPMLYLHKHTCTLTHAAQRVIKKGYEGTLLLAHMFTICHHCDGLNTTAGAG